MSEINPFSNIIQYIPKDSPYSEKGQIYPVDHFAITSTEIAAIDSGQGGAPSRLVDPNNTPSSGGAGGGVSLDNLVPLIVDYGPTKDEAISSLEPTTVSYTLTAFADVKNLNDDFLEFQWEKLENGSTTWNEILGATSTTYVLPAGLNTTNDSGDSYRCRISHPGAINTPVYTALWTLNFRRVITITSQPVFPSGINQGDTATLSVTGTITSGTINYQWQKRESDSPDFIDIVGATSSSYTTDPLFSGTNTGDQYRCVLSAEFADNVISDPTEVFVIGSDIKVVPAVNGITFWSFQDHGSLILDPSVSPTYNLTNVGSYRTKLPAIMWGQGTCAAQGGYTEGAIPVEFQDTYTVKLNTGGGAAGFSDSGRYAEPGGGYSGIFEGETVSQETTLLIAGGAGGGSLNTTTCGGTQQSVGYPITTSYIGTCYNNINNNGCVAHSYNNNFCGDNYLYHSFQSVFTTGCGTRQYYVFYRNSFPDTNYSFSVYGVSSCSAAGGVCPGFYVSSQKYTWGALLQFYRRDTGANSYVASFCISASASYPYSCTQYTTNTYYYAGQAAAYGGDGGGSSGGNGDNGPGSLISATGGFGASQLSGGSGGTNTQGYNGSAGSALQGGSGGANSGSYAAAGGGGGGGGYYGGGGGAGGYDNANSGIGPQAGGGGGGGSGYIDATVTNGSTGTYSNVLDPDRGTAGDNQQNSRLVIKESYINITSQPSSTAVTEGSPATFTVEASLETYFNDAAISYQWQKKSSGSLLWVNISGATSSSYTTSNLTVSNNNDSYRCVLVNQYTENVITNEASSLVFSSATPVYSLTTPGQYNIDVPSGVESFTFKIWGAGGGGSGEGSVRRGGSGGFASGTITVPSDNTNSISVFVGAAANGGPPNPNLGYGSGADAGGARSSITFGSEQIIAGGGGGAGQGGHGGYGGGANRSGGSGTGSYAGGGASTSGGGGGGSSNDRPGGAGTTGSYGGGTGGGTGQCCGMRGGGGGSGLYGGGGGGGGYSSYDGSGGGGGSGYATLGITSLVTSDGSTGTSSGASVPNSSDPDYVSGHGGSSQPGLVIIELAYSYDFEISPEVAGKSFWSTVADGPLILDGSISTSYTLTAIRNVSLPANMWGQGSSNNGGYSTGTISFTTGDTYSIRLNAGAGGGGTGYGWPGNGGSGGGYAGLFRTTSISQSNALMIAGGSGGSGGYSCGAGGIGGGSSGNSGCSSTNSEIGSTGGGGGSQSSGGGAGGGALQGGSGGNGVLGGYSNAGGGGGGGGGYFGGGGGGGGNDFGNTTRQSSSGGGGSGYINSTYVTDGSTGSYQDAPNRGNAGQPGYSSRIVIG
jgi:hypothetical protein